MSKDMNSERLSAISQKAFSEGERTAQNLIPLAAKEAGMPGAINAIGQFLIGGLQVLAMCVAKHVDPGTEEGREAYNPLEVIGPETLLFSALLINKMAPEYDRERHAIECQFGPHVLFETMMAYEKMMDGKKPDAHLTEKLVEVAREVGVGGAEPFKAFMERMKNAPPSPKSMN